MTDREATNACLENLGSSLATERSSADATQAATAAELADARQQILRLVDQAVIDQQVTTRLADDLLAATAECADLRRQIDLMTHPTLMGASIRGTLAGRTSLNAARVFVDGALPRLWSDHPGIVKAVALGAKAIVLSWKDSDPAKVAAFTPPPGVTVYGVWHHEPENDYGDPIKYRSVWATVGPACRAAGMVPTVILMRYTLNANSGRDWHDWFPAGSVDVIGFDSYNLGNKKATYATAETQLGPIVAAASEVGLPWLIGETGAPVFRDPSERVAWAKELRTYATANGARVVCWWDQTGGMDFRLDDATASVFLD